MARLLGEVLLPGVHRAFKEDTPLPEAPHTPLLPKILDFSFFAILSPELSLVPCDGMHELWNALGMQPMPASPRDSVDSDRSSLKTARVNFTLMGTMGPLKPQGLGLRPPPSTTCEHMIFSGFA